MEPTQSPLEHEHTVDAIRARLASNDSDESLGDFVLGAIDGTITTFAIVSGVAGAGLTAGVALVLGLANVLADGFSMAIGNFLKARSDQQVVEKYRRMEERHIEQTPDGEREEIRQIFAAKGFEGDVLERIVDVIAEDPKQWVDTMITEEWGLPLRPPSPVKAGSVTFVAFVAAGFVPLAPLLFNSWLGASTTFVASAIATAITFLAIGAVRGRVAHQSMLWSSLETLGMGGVAATMAFGVGHLLREFTGVSV